ncbi:hypothetical protein KKC59_04545, partial [bacterium]|nr:hypothetical protein [bacterium]
ICCMLCFCYENLKEEKILDSLIKGLDALYSLMPPGGEVLCYGRSSHSVLGYASALAAYEKAIGFIEDKEKRSQYADAVCRLRRVLEKFICEDGHVRVVLNEDKTTKSGWDDYMHLSFYNAFTAALLLMLKPNPNVDYKLSELKQGLVVLQKSGLARYLNKDTYSFFTLKGQGILNDSIYFCDIRYAGMQINLFQYKNKNIIGNPCINKTDILDPANAGFVPFIEQSGKKYFVKKFDQVDFGQTENFVFCIGRGTFAEYVPSSIFYKFWFKFASFLFEKDKVYFDKLFSQNLKLISGMFFIPKYEIFVFINAVVNIGEAFEADVSLTNFRLLDTGHDFTVDVIGNSLKSITAVKQTSLGLNKIESFKETLILTKDPYVNVFAVKEKNNNINVEVKAKGSKYEIVVKDVSFIFDVFKCELEEKINV